VEADEVLNPVYLLTLLKLQIIKIVVITNGHLGQCRLVFFLHDQNYSLEGKVSQKS